MRRASQLLLVMLVLPWLVSSPFLNGRATPALADASVCASPGFVLQRVPLSDSVQDVRVGAGQRLADDAVNPRSLAAADLSATLADSPDSILPGNMLTYTITAQNAGPDDADDTVLTAVLPTGTTFVSINYGGCWTCNTPAVGTHGTVSCDHPNFFDSTSEVFTLVVHVTNAVPLGSQIEQTVTIAGNVIDAGSSNDSATAITTVPAATPTITPTPTVTGTPTQTLTPTVTPTGTIPPATTATPTPTLVPSATVTPTATSTVPPTKATSDDKSRPKTETQRQHDDHTNQLGRDDYHTEGNVMEVVLDAQPPYAMIATRDGLVRVVLSCEDGCPVIRVGDYLQADGVKENEGLFNADEVTISR